MSINFSPYEVTVMQAALRHLLDLCNRKKQVANALRHCCYDADQRTKAEADFSRFDAAERRVERMIAKLEITLEIAVA